MVVIIGCFEPKQNSKQHKPYTGLERERERSRESHPIFVTLVFHFSSSSLFNFYFFVDHQVEVDISKKWTNPHPPPHPPFFFFSKRTNSYKVKIKIKIRKRLRCSRPPALHLHFIQPHSHFWDTTQITIEISNLNISSSFFLFLRVNFDHFNDFMLYYFCN